ncbi:signal peptidase I [Orrella sp. 11846]|uniref:signal peptidase I n=1 Tax=Orrella sp. 11846 TaxID=3409913 RepID=UPI003B5CF0BA
MSWNFSLLLFIALVITGIVWLVDRLFLRSKRAADAKTPWWVEYCASFFPVIVFVFVLRSFVVEPFRIPSGSMLPTLKSGDLILVNKFTYGLRLPILHTELVEFNKPERGDVIVFRYPVEPDVDYIKRLIGLPGDEVAYLNKRLYINGKEVPVQRDGEYYEPDRLAYASQFIENLGPVENKILVDQRSRQDLRPIWRYPYRDQCQYRIDGMVCTVPENMYFMMGDNRDNSLDSRFWGFVPAENIVGKAFFIWMNFSEPSRIGSFH